MNYSVGTKLRPVRNIQGQYTFKSRIIRAYRWTMHKVKWGLAIGAAAYALALAGFLYANAEAANTVTVVNQIAPHIEATPAILNKICMAESGCHQFAKNGVVTLHANTSGQYAGTVDIGKYGINNAAWGAQATKLGYDLMTENGNEQMAKWILENYGSEPWYSSKGKWLNK